MFLQAGIDAWRNRAAAARPDAAAPCCKVNRPERQHHAPLAGCTVSRNLLDLQRYSILNPSKGCAMSSRAAEAETLFAPLRAVAPEAATPDRVAQCKQALLLLANDAGSDLWCEIQIKLGIFLLELRECDRTANVAQARAAYGAVLDRIGP